jgi:hypothetical protein
MAHKYPRNAFLTVGNGHGNHVLVRLYSVLVAMELALKDANRAIAGTWSSGHDVPTMMSAYDAALGGSLGVALSQLRCTDKFGNTAPVATSNYPHIRYLRHETDFPPPPVSSSDGDITATLNIAIQCLGVIRAAGLLT